MAKAALYGYDFWKNYCKTKRIPFKEDGVIEAASDDKSSKTLFNHFEWGLKNGLEKKDIEIIEKKDIERIEPNLKCQYAILCNRDASVDYGQITHNLANDIENKNKVTVIKNSKVVKIKYKRSSNEKIFLKYKDTINHTENELVCDFLINAAGGNSLDILNMTGIVHRYNDLHFRGEYWIAPVKYRALTYRSIYSVPEFPHFPFLDPHWIIRSNGSREIGPNACPVFSPFGYNKFINMKEFFPKIYELAKALDIKIKNGLINKEIPRLIFKETLSSLSKTYMVKRVKKFLPSLQARDFGIKGTSGIRSNLIDNEGNFILNPIFILKDNVFHILNYNSPGATGAFPISYSIASKLIENGIIREDRENYRDVDMNKIVLFDEKLIECCMKEINIDFE